MKAASDALLGFLAGFVITLGACAYLSLDNKMAGALLFTVGLFAICSFGWNLFTGKVCYSIGKGPRYLAFLLIVWLANFAGAAAGGLMMRATRLTGVVERAQELCAAKLGDGLWSVFILAVFCNVLIYIAVEGYRSIPNAAGKYLAVFFGVTVFVVCGFEHCVANMFYFTVSGMWSGEAVIFIVVNTIGNAVGGLLVPALTALSEACLRRARDTAGTGK